MNNKQENTLSMDLGTGSYLDLHHLITALLPGFSALFLLFKANNAEMLSLREKQEINKSGIRDRKQLLRIVLASKAYDISHKTEVYATLINDLILAKEVHFPETSLYKAADSKLESRAQIILEKATANIADLAEYGVVAADLTTLQDAIELFHDAIPTTRTGTTEKKLITDRLVKLLKDNNEILDKIDLLIDIVRFTQPIFYSGYKENRKIIYTGTGSLALMAHASDAETGDAIKGAKFTFVFQDGTGSGKGSKVVASFVKVTAAKGNLNVKTMAYGSYVVTIEKAGYKKQVIVVNKAAGDRIKLKVKLEKI